MNTSTSSGSRAARIRTSRLLAALVKLVLLLLAVQFLVGMVVNLFVTLPASHPGAQADNYFVGVAQGVSWAVVAGALPLQVHVVIGLLLLVASVASLVLAIASRRSVWIITAVLGWLGIMAAGFNGASFLNYGHDFSSMIMSIGFLLALSAYAIGLYQAR